MRLALALLLLTTVTQAQWQLQQSNTTADLRGIHALGNGVAWASGSKGTILRTTDQGKTWQTCAVPPGAEALDFRGIQAFDARTAIVMSSGKGDLSRLYKTTDACKIWKPMFSNPDPEGFWDALIFESPNSGWLLGDPVDGSFTLYASDNGGLSWTRQKNAGLHASPKQGSFAASNTSLLAQSGMVSFATGGPDGAFLYSRPSIVTCLDDCSAADSDFAGRKSEWRRERIDLGNNSAASGIFSLGSDGKGPTVASRTLVAVGGDYLHPLEAKNIAAFLSREQVTWNVADTQPLGYRSAVAYDKARKTWITVGPNGTDTSTDDGRNWRPLRPGPQGASDEDQHWNALSLPFVVGPHGRIGILRPDALAAAPGAK